MQLRQYQIDISDAACKLLNEHKIAYLNMQIRTGKTITSLETAKKFGAKAVLFVTKKKAISSIESDYLANYANDFKLYLINFEMLHKVTDTSYDLVIIDEAHSLGQYPTCSLRTSQLKKLCKHKPIIYLSGTPSPESYSQLFHQFWVSYYSPFPEANFYQWAKTYVNVKERYVFNRKLNDYSEADYEKIKPMIDHLFIPYTQEEAGFKEEINEHIVYVDMQDKIYKICDRLKKDKVVIGKEGQVIEADTEVKLLNKLHQIYSGTCIFDNSSNTDGIILDDTKINYVLDNFKGNKIAIYYKFRAEYMMCLFQIRCKGLFVAESPEHFNATDDKYIFLSQFVSGREGINLSSADCLICINIDFSAITYFQVRGRIQSKDRVKTSDVYWIFARNGIEDRIYKAVSNKKNYTLNYFKKDMKLNDKLSNNG